MDKILVEQEKFFRSPSNVPGVKLYRQLAHERRDRFGKSSLVLDVCPAKRIVYPAFRFELDPGQVERVSNDGTTVATRHA
jgi:hypothetical protein